MPTVPRGFKGGAGGRFAVVVSGGNSLVAKLNAYGISTSSKVYDAVKRAHLMVEAEAKRLITSGYYKPAIDTGRLRMSITSGIVNFDRNYIEAKVGSNVYYGIYVHDGTKRMEKRPFLTDALEKKKEKIKEMIKIAIKLDVGMKNV